MDPLTLAVVGAAYGTSIVAGVSRRALKKGEQSDAFLAGFVACGVTAILAIITEHRLDFGTVARALIRLEYVSTLLAGPMLLFYVNSLRKPAPPKTLVLHAMPAALALVIPASVQLPIEIVIGHQLLYTLVTGYRRWAIRKVVDRDRLLSVALIGMMLLIHGSQAARLLLQQSGLIDIIPVVASLAMLTGGALAIHAWSSRTNRQRRSSHIDRASKTVSSADQEILDTLRAILSEEHFYRRTDLGLHDLAARLEISPHQLSAALNAGGGTTMLELLNGYRLDDSKRRLLDPGHDIYTIEAIGQMSGFGSRSTFHAIFRRATGITPTQYRAAHRS